MNREVYCSCGARWPDVIEPRPGVTFCGECGALLVKVEAVPKATLEAIWGPGHIPPLDAVRKPR